MKKHTSLIVISFLVGVVLSYYFTYLPWKVYASAQHFEQTYCKISEVYTQSKSLTIYYKYRWKKEEYTGHRINLAPQGLNDLQDKYAILEKYRLNSVHPCYVNPDNPTEAVLDRKLTVFMLFTLTPFIYFFVCIMLLVENKSTSRLVPSIAHSGFYEITENSLLIRRILLSLIVTIMTGVVTILMYFDYWLPHSIDAWNLSLIPTLVLAFFVLVEMLLIANVIIDIVKLFNPKIELSINASDLEPGKEYRLHYEFKNTSKKIIFLSFSLVCTQKIEQTQEQLYNENCLFSQIFFKRNAPVELQDDVNLMIPSNAYPSSQNGNSQTIWTIKCEYKFNCLPTMEREYQIGVHG